MKKVLLATVVAAILSPVAATADTTVYGALRMSALTGEKGTANIGGVVNNASRIGIKGSYGDEGGLTGFFNIQGGADTDTGGVTGFSSRFAFAGVKGGFGKVVMGRLSSPYKMAGLKVDPFYDTSAGVNNGGSNYGLSNLTNGWLNNVVGYISPKLGGAVTINAVAVLDKDDSKANVDNTKNLFNIGATYSKSGVTASVQHITEIDATRLALGYKAGPISGGISYEDLDADDALYVSGKYKVAPRTSLAASYGKMSIGTDKVRNVDGTGFALGVFQTLAPKTTLTAMYSDVDATNDANDRNVFSVGLIQKF